MIYGYAWKNIKKKTKKIKQNGAKSKEITKRNEETRLT